jgi:hypothetical protein
MFRHSSLFQFQNGDHTCVFYRSENELMEVISPFIADGLLRGDRCFCVQKPEVLSRLIYDLQFLGIDTDHAVKSGALDLHVEDETYFPENNFEPEAMMDLLIRAISKSQAEGFTAFRSAGELSWAIEGKFDCDKVVGYEKMVDEYYPGQPAIGLCQYDVNKFPPDVLEHVVSSHRQQITETASQSRHASIHVRHNGYEVEIVADKLTLNPPYYYVAKQHHSPFDVVGWGVEHDFETVNSKVKAMSGM